MGEKNDFLIVSQEVLPDVFRCVVEVKRLLEGDNSLTINQAVKQVGISRSAYYKYKDAVFSFTEGSRGKIITLSLVLADSPGILSGILNRIAKAQGNILTINQNIPLHGVANVTISVDTKEMKDGQESLLQAVGHSEGVHKIEILAQE